MRTRQEIAELAKKGLDYGVKEDRSVFLASNDGVNSGCIAGLAAVGLFGGFDTAYQTFERQRVKLSSSQPLNFAPSYAAMATILNISYEDMVELTKYHKLYSLPEFLETYAIAEKIS